MRKLSQQGLNLLKSLEGLKLKAYPDVGGVWTVGYGHTGDDVTSLSEFTDEKAAEAVLLQDVKKFEEGVDQLVKVQLNANQFSALVIFAYNIGLAAFKNSQCLVNVNRGYEGEMVTHEISRWSKVGQTVIPGLVNRRNKEIDLWKTPVQ